MDFKFCQTILFRLFIFAFSTLGLGTPTWGIEPQEILSRSLEAQFQHDLEGIKKTEFHTHQKDYMLTARFIRLGPDFSYLLYLSPSKLKGRMILDDGSSRKDYAPHKKKLRIYPSLNSSPMQQRRRENLKLLLKNYTISRQPDEFILGRPSYVISLIPWYPGNPRLDIWVDKRTYLPLKKERYNAEGKLVASSSFVPFNLRKEFFREGIYRSVRRILGEEIAPAFPPFSTLQEIGRMVKFHLKVPDYLPPGYVFQGASLVDEEMAVKLTYTNGLGVICFFQRPRANIKMGNFQRLSFGSSEGKIRLGEDEKTLVWNKSRMTFVLMGDISKEELRRIAESVK
jgi:negative regulator of sigma E activity